MPNGNAEREIEELARRGKQIAHVLFAGDTVTAGVTHQIEVGRDKSWVKYEATTTVQDGETASDARTRAIGHVNESAMVAVETTVRELRNMR